MTNDKLNGCSVRATKSKHSYAVAQLLKQSNNMAHVISTSGYDTDISIDDVYQMWGTIELSLSHPSHIHTNLNFIKRWNQQYVDAVRRNHC